LPKAFGFTATERTQRIRRTLDKSLISQCRASLRTTSHSRNRLITSHPTSWFNSIASFPGSWSTLNAKYSADRFTRIESCGWDRFTLSWWWSTRSNSDTERNNNYTTTGVSTFMMTVNYLWNDWAGMCRILNSKSNEAIMQNQSRNVKCLICLNVRKILNYT